MCAGVSQNSFPRVLLCAGVVGVGPAGARRDQQVSVDLRYGLVTGYSPFVSFLQTPTAPPPGGGPACASQAVLRLTLSGPYRGVRLEVCVCVSVCLSVCLSACVSICVCVCLAVCLSARPC